MIHTMKNIFKFITIGIALLAGSITANAQTWNTEGGVSTKKTVSDPDENGLYTITLETYATGESSITETARPVDIVLVLDVSGSMDEKMDSYQYTARDSQSYSYNNYPYNTSYYYLHTDGKYYEVNDLYYYGYYFLYFTVDDTYYFLSGTGVTTEVPDNVTSANTTIWTGVLYNRTIVEGPTKISELKRAAAGFVNEVHHNALYDTKGKLRVTPLDNQISVVKYAMNRYVNANGTVQSTGNNPATASGYNVINPGNHFDGNGYNATEVVVGFTDVSTADGVNRVMGEANYVGINDFSSGGATASDFGMTKARYLLETVQDRESNKVVVLFTDGSPTYQRDFNNTVANNTISIANTIKNTLNATVYTIGVFDNETTNINTYMNRVSSNYPNATGMGNGGAGTGGGDNGYYQNASNNDLSAIFKEIASAASQSDATVGASTQVRDVVSNSFIIPEGASADDVTIYTMDITEDGNGWENPQTPAGVTAVYKTTTGSDGVEREMLSVEGFDFTKADVKDAAGFTTRENMGNFVGERYKPDGSTFWAGRKLVIEFKVQANGAATGGAGSATNHSDSGVYIYDPETDTYTNINHYPVPHTTLPMIIKIKKDGLRHGESATFEIHMCEPLKDDDGNILYNAIGKPRPDTSTDRNWSKVILTNKGADGDPVEKVLMALDPNYVYSIIEDDWSWSYTLSGTGTTLTTSEVEVNPFIFHNTEKSGVVKHAEAVSINHFATSAEGEAKVENYQSKKVGSFNSTTDGGSGNSGESGSTEGGSK